MSAIQQEVTRLDAQIKEIEALTQKEPRLASSYKSSLDSLRKRKQELETREQEPISSSLGLPKQEQVSVAQKAKEGPENNAPGITSIEGRKDGVVPAKTLDTLKELLSRESFDVDKDIEERRKAREEYQISKEAAERGELWDLLARKLGQAAAGYYGVDVSKAAAQPTFDWTGKKKEAKLDYETVLSELAEARKAQQAAKTQKVEGLMGISKLEQGEESLKAEEKAREEEKQARLDAKKEKAAKKQKEDEEAKLRRRQGAQAGSLSTQIGQLEKNIDELEQQEKALMKVPKLIEQMRKGGQAGETEVAKGQLKELLSIADPEAELKEPGLWDTLIHGAKSPTPGIVAAAKDRLLASRKDKKAQLDAARANLQKLRDQVAFGVTGAEEEAVPEPTAVKAEPAPTPAPAPVAQQAGEIQVRATDKTDPNYGQVRKVKRTPKVEELIASGRLQEVK